MNMYRIGDGGETYWYVAGDEEVARALHRKFGYANAGEPTPTPEEEADWSVVIVPPDKVLRFTDVDESAPQGVAVERTAAEWVAFAGEPDFLATSLRR